jgi:predicted esterase
MFRLTLCLVCLLATLGISRGDVEVGPRNVEVGPRDVAASYFVFEQTLSDHPPVTREQRVRVNRYYDRFGRWIWRRAWERAVLDLSMLTSELLPDRLNLPGDQAARLTMVDVEPAMPTVGLPATVTLAPVQDVADRPNELQVRFLDTDGNGKVERFQTSGDTIQWQPQAAGRYDVQVRRWPGGRWWNRGEVTAVLESSNAVREELLSRLGDAETDLIAEVRRRLDLLLDFGTEGRPSSLVEDAAALQRDLRAEVEAVLRGENPYVQRPGTYWTTLADIPVILHASPKVVASPEPRPLVIALHGAGMDENLFILGFGDGKLRRLADERGFVLASVSTYALLGRGDRLPDLIAAINERYDIDESRVYALGHSLGAITISGWILPDDVGTAREHLTAIALLAGGGEPTEVKGAVPTLIVAAGDDRIFRVSRLRSIHDAIERLDVRAEFRLYPDESHVSVVRESLDEVVTWLLRQRSAE